MTKPLEKKTAKALDKCRKVAQQAVDLVDKSWLRRTVGRLIAERDIEDIHTKMAAAEKALLGDSLKAALDLWEDSLRKTAMVLDTCRRKTLGKIVVRQRHQKRVGTWMKEFQRVKYRLRHLWEQKPKRNACADLFDASFYLRNAPELGGANRDPLEHYLTDGWKQNRSPHPFFDVAWYLAQNPDVASSGLEPLAHFLKQGWRENRPPHPLFDLKWYLERYPDVAQAGINPLLHYQRYGAAECRSPHPLFDIAWYRKKYADDLAGVRDYPAFYLEYGWKRGHWPNPSFDPQLYLETNPELKAAGTEPLRHFVIGGGVLPPSTKTPGENPWNADQPFSAQGMWIATRIVCENMNRLISGDPQKNWIQHVMETSFAPILRDNAGKATRILLLGSNEGRMQRQLWQEGYRGTMVASDIAEKALRRAKALDEEMGIDTVEYVLADLNKDSFAGGFDFVFAEGVLHHIAEIESCLANLDRVMLPHAMMAMMEFEGPFRFQLSELQVRWINVALAAIPRSLRPLPRDREGVFPISSQEALHTFYVPPSEESIVAFDPSEAVTGPQLKKLIPERFRLVERVGYGGPLLSYMTGHFDFERADVDEFAAAWLRQLMSLESTLISTGILDHEYIFQVVAKHS